MFAVQQYYRIYMALASAQGHWRGQKSPSPLWKARFSLSTPSIGPRYGFPLLKINISRNIYRMGTLIVNIGLQSWLSFLSYNAFPTRAYIFYERALLRTLAQYFNRVGAFNKRNLLTCFLWYRKLILSYFSLDLYQVPISEKKDSIRLYLNAWIWIRPKKFVWMDCCTVFPLFRSGGDKRPRTYSKRPLTPGPLILPAEEVTTPRVSDPYLLIWYGSGSRIYRSGSNPDPGFWWPKFKNQLQLKKKLNLCWIKNYNLPIPRPP